MWKNPYVSEPYIVSSNFNGSDEHHYAFNLFSNKIDKTEWKKKIAENMNGAMKERNDEFGKSKEYKVAFEVWEESVKKYLEKYSEYLNSQMCIDAMAEFVKKHSSISNWESYPDSFQTQQKWGLKNRDQNDFEQNKKKINDLLK